MDDRQETVNTSAASATLDGEATVEQLVALLEKIAADRGVLAELPENQRHALLEAAGRVAFPGRTARRQLTQAFRKQKQAAHARRRSVDGQLLAQTGIRAQQRRRLQHAHSTAPLPWESASKDSSAHVSSPQPRLQLPRNCYICKQDFEIVHQFYDALCPRAS